MSSPTFETLRDTLQQVRRRRTRLYLIYHSSLVATGVLALVLGLSFLAAWLQPPPALIFLFSLILLAGAGFMVWRFLQALSRMRSNDRQLAHYVEENIPDLEQRLLTSLEFTEAADDQRRGVSAQFIERLWQDAQTHVAQQQAAVEKVAFSRNAPVAGMTAAGLAVLTVATFMLSDTTRLSGGQLLWPFSALPEQGDVALLELDVPPEVEIRVEPGDRSMQRGEALNIVARIVNADPGDVQLRMQSDNVNWQTIDMRRDGGSSSEALYSHQLPSMQNELIYYVSFDGGEQRSREYRISLYELPRVEQIDVALNYPEYTGIENNEEEDGGDLVVPEGTEVTLEVHFNKPVRTALMQFENEQGSYEDLSLLIDGDRGQVSFTVDRDAVYRVAAVDFDRLESENPFDYYIRAIPDEPPELVLISPGSDQDVMPLEEVLLEVEAHDDYGLSDFTLHYSVVGGDEISVGFLPDEQQRSVTANEMIYLEDLDVQPGDFVSYYLTLADNNALRGPQTVVSDIYFLQVTPTDAQYRQAGGGGGGGGGGQMGGQGGGDGSALVTLQKDIIAATWKLRNEVEQIPAQQFSDDVAVLAESQRDAIQRARMSIDRLSERLDFADDSYGNAVANLRQAIEYMNDAVDALQLEQVGSALQPEQQALQYVLRAEADINSTDVNFERTAGGGGGGNRNQQERQDLQELFEMEMGRNENRYATPERGGGNQAQSEEASRLEELARRQEGLTRAQRNLSRRMDDMSEEQRRRELERLRREQEQLSADLDQLSQQMNRRQQASQQQGQQGQQGGAEQQMQRALEQMRDAAQADSPAQAAARSQRALESLREQQRQMEQQQQSSSVNQLAQNLSQRGEQLARQQRSLQEALQELGREQGLGQNRLESRSDEQLRQLVEQQQQQRRELEEIEQMLRAIGARADNEQQTLLSQAQRASRAVRPIREQMENSNRVLDNGMVNLALDLERDIGDALAQLGQSLQSMNPGRERRGNDDNASMQVAEDASELRDQIESLRQQAEAYQQDRDSLGSVADMRQQLALSRELAEQLNEQLQDQAAEPGNGARQGNNAQAGQAGGTIPEEGEAAALGYARSIRSVITGRDLEDFLNQPELLAQLGESLVELERTLRSRAELDQIERRLFAGSDDEVPEQYRQMVDAYYRALSDNGGSADSAQ